MNIVCKECGEMYDLKIDVCPKCGAPNFYRKNMVSGNGNVQNKNLDSTNEKITNPKTIEELKKWYVQENLPAESTTRFFIGKDYRGARAFGIYKDNITGNIVVYKNKADGSRAVRYQGRDEAYAVGEIWLKLREEILNQKSTNANTGYRNSRSIYSGDRVYTGRTYNLNFSTIIVIIFFIGMIAFQIYTATLPKRGYYRYNNTYYYSQNGRWYEYDYDRDYNHWVYTSNIPITLKNNKNKYYDSSYYSGTYNIDRFEDSNYYVPPSTSSSSSSSYYDDDDDYSWSSSDSWDSSSTDWDSDW